MARRGLYFRALRRQAGLPQRLDIWSSEIKCKINVSVVFTCCQPGTPKCNGRPPLASGSPSATYLAGCFPNNAVPDSEISASWRSAGRERRPCFPFVVGNCAF